MVITDFCVKRINLENIVDNNSDSEARVIYTLLMALPDNFDKIKIFTIILNGIFSTFHYDYTKSSIKFNQRPYFKLLYTFIYLFHEFPNNAIVLGGDNTKIKYICLIAQFLKFLSPQYYPGFALAWLELISSENFMSCFLGDVNPQIIYEEEKTDIIPDYLSLISELFIFLKKCSNNEANKIFMDYVHKYIYLLCETYPEFIIENYYILITELSYENICIQLKNLLLSTIPKKFGHFENINFEDKDLESELNKNTLGDYDMEISSNIINCLRRCNILTYIDKYIENPNFNFVKNLCENFNRKKENINFNFFIMQCLVIYYGFNSLKKNKKISESYNFFLNMMKLLDMETRIILMISLLNQLRFPSNQTLYFLLIMLNILTNINNEEIEEIFISLLLERLFVKPIPWGIILLFKKVLKGNIYDLMNTNYFKNLKGGKGFINKLKEFLENKNLVKFINIGDDEIN